MEPQKPAKAIPRANDHRPDPSAQSRLLGWLVLGTGLAIFLPCLTLVITEAAGFTHLRASLVQPNGTLTVEVDDPTAYVSVSSRFMSMGTNASQQISLRPGEYNVTVTSYVSGTQTHNEMVSIEPGKETVVVVPWTTVPPADESAESATDVSSESTQPSGSP